MYCLCYSTNKLLQKQKSKHTLTIQPTDRMFWRKVDSDTRLQKNMTCILQATHLYLYHVMALSMLRQTASSARIISTKEIALVINLRKIAQEPYAPGFSWSGQTATSSRLSIGARAKFFTSGGCSHQDIMVCCSGSFFFRSV